MANRPRGPWFRFLANRDPAAPPPRPPPLTPAPAPAPVRPSLPIRPPPQPRVASPSPPPPPPALPAIPPPLPPTPAPTAPRSPVRAPAPLPSPPRAPPRSPVAPPAPPPRSPVKQPAQPSPPSSPLTRSQAPSSSTQAPPIIKPVATTEAVNGRASTPTASPKVIKPFEKIQPDSPEHKLLSRPPSPFTLPPAQIKPDGKREPVIKEKAVVVQQTTDKQVRTLRAHSNGIASNGKREPTSKEGMSKKHSGSEELEVRVITLAGENKGAVMELSPSRKKNHTVNPQNLHKNGDRSGSENGGEGKSRNKEKAIDEMTMQSPVMSYFNSNVQGLNNSIVYDTTFQQQDPGIHLSLRKANGNCYKDKLRG